jgi:hypothetical protein
MAADCGNIESLQTIWERAKEELTADESKTIENELPLKWQKRKAPPRCYRFYTSGQKRNLYQKNCII